MVTIGDLIRPDRFFDRRQDLESLESLWRRKGAGMMAMVYGRRRLGKTFMLQKFLSDRAEDAPGTTSHCYYLADQSTSEVQRFALASRLLAALPSESLSAADIAVSWNALLHYFSSSVAKRRGKGRTALVLDEFPNAVAQSPELPSVLQAWWDQEGVHLPVFVILCGSQLSVMAALGNESAPLFGRFNAGARRLEPMRYDDVAEFYRHAPRFGTREKLFMYGALGGTPRYHAMVDENAEWDDELVNLLMRPGAPLENEVRFLLSSEQVRDPAPHNSILWAIAHGRTKYGEIGNATGIDHAALAYPLRVLQELDWVRKEHPYGEKSEKRALYRIGDPFLSFWYRFVAPNGSALQFDDPRRVFRDRVAPYLSDYMGWAVFEGVCAQWLKRRAREELGICLLDLGRYWNRDGTNEIDLVGRLDRGNMLFGECKWSENREVGLDTYIDLRTKVAALPERHWAEGAVYVLFALGGFTESLMNLAKSESNLHLIDGSRLFDF
jgi:AAA+ ATPase superfamily predicted ATPase